MLKIHWEKTSFMKRDFESKTWACRLNYLFETQLVRSEDLSKKPTCEYNENEITIKITQTNQDKAFSLSWYSEGEELRRAIDYSATITQEQDVANAHGRREGKRGVIDQGKRAGADMWQLWTDVNWSASASLVSAPEQHGITGTCKITRYKTACIRKSYSA